MTDINKLEELAKAATPGPWAICPETNGQELVAYDVAPWKIRDEIVGVYRYPPNWLANAAYIAAANPATILSLISQYRRMEEALRPFAAAADDLSEDHWDELDVWESPAAGSINGGHLRAARQALQDQDQ